MGPVCGLFSSATTLLSLVYTPRGISFMGHSAENMTSLDRRLANLSSRSQMWIKMFRAILVQGRHCYCVSTRVYICVPCQARELYHNKRPHQQTLQYDMHSTRSPTSHPTWVLLSQVYREQLILKEQDLGTVCSCVGRYYYLDYGIPELA